MRNTLLFAGMMVMFTLILSGCIGMSAQFRQEMCPKCTDAQWKQINSQRPDAPFGQNDPKVKACMASCAQEQPVCSAKVSLLLGQKASTSAVSEQLSICTSEDRQCTNACLGIVEPIKKQKLSNAVIWSAVTDNNLIDPTKKPRTRRERYLSDSPLWDCLNPNHWSSPCRSAPNTKGKTFLLTAKFEAFNPPSEGFSISDIAKVFIKGCGLQAKGRIIGSPALHPEIFIMNVGLQACNSIQKLRVEKGDLFRGTMHISLDGEEVKFCDYYRARKKGLDYTPNPLGCVQKFFADETKREAFFAYTGVRALNKYGSADAVHILHSCANRNNWASTGRDATSEEVAFCETRKTLQTDKSYWLEARQLNLGGGNETIKITIGQNKSSELNLVQNTRIRLENLVYHCGNKSFDRMRNKPRDTAAACIEDMLAIIKAKRSSLSPDLQYDAARMDSLGGYGRSHAEDLEMVTCREASLYDQNVRKCKRLWD